MALELSQGGSQRSENDAGLRKPDALDGGAASYIYQLHINYVVIFFLSSCPVGLASLCSSGFNAACIHTYIKKEFSGSTKKALGGVW
jgi:hypothetical protein